MSRLVPLAFAVLLATAAGAADTATGGSTASRIIRPGIGIGKVELG